MSPVFCGTGISTNKRYGVVLPCVLQLTVIEFYISSLYCVSEAFKILHFLLQVDIQS